MQLSALCNNRAEFLFYLCTKLLLTIDAVLGLSHNS